jgi:hypothetical protein
MYGLREAAPAEAKNRDEVYPRLVLRRKPTGPLMTIRMVTLTELGIRLVRAKMTD